jgi:hypothetical protein
MVLVLEVASHFLRVMEREERQENSLVNENDRGVEEADEAVEEEVVRREEGKRVVEGAAQWRSHRRKLLETTEKGFSFNILS